MVEETNSTISMKRPEENYKFVFKRCMRRMHENFKKQQKRMHRGRHEVEDRFHRYYFEETARNTGLPLEAFKDPKSKNRKSGETMKTINSRYIDNISKSQKFISDFSQIMNHELISEYMKVIDSKFDSLFARWEEKLKGSSMNSGVEAICRYIEDNKKCKLPWTIVEINSAIISVKNLFESRQL